MRFRDGTAGQKALFAALVGVYVLGLLVALQDKLERVGQPDIGWTMDGANISPSRWDAAAAGLRGGGLAIRINDVDYNRLTLSPEGEAVVRTGIGERNTLLLRRPGGRVQEVTIVVRSWEWSDLVFAEGTTIGLGALFVIVGVTSFLLRPYA